MGGDADTNACVAGSVLGCLMGYSELPKDYIENLNQRSYLYDLTYYYLRMVNNPEGFTANPPTMRIVNKDIEIEVDIYNHSYAINIELLKNSKYLEDTDTINYWFFGKKNFTIKDLENILVKNKIRITNFKIEKKI